MSENVDILDQLKSDDPEMIREAAYAAGQNRVEAAVPLLVGHIQSSNIGVQEAADMAIRQIGGEDTVRAISPLLRNDDAPIRNIAMDVLREIGGLNLPALIELLRDDDVDVRIFVADIMGTSGNPGAVAPLSEALLRDPEVNVRYQAAVSLGVLGFADAADSLNKAMEDEEWVQFSVIEALIKIGADSSVGALARALETSSDLVASMVVDALGEMGNMKAVPILLKRLDSSPGPLRNKVVKALVNLLGGKSLTLLDDKERERFRLYLLAALEDEEEDIQDAAMTGLSFVGGEKATTAVMGIASGLDADRDHERLVRAVACLASIGLNNALTEIIRSGEEYPVLIAVEAISQMDSAEARTLLMEVFWDKERDQQRAIVNALLSVDASARDFFLDVLERHDDGNVLKAALYFLGKNIGDEETGERLFAALEHPYDDVKEAALEACIAHGEPAMNDRFKEFFHSSEPIQRLMAVYAMGKLDVETNQVELVAALEDEVPDIRKVALEALFDVCPEDSEFIEVAVPRLHDENREVRLALVELLGGCVSGEIIPYLVQALDDEDDWVRVRAIEALGRSATMDIVEKLVPLLSAESALVKFKTIEALGTIGGKVAFRALLSLLDDADPEVQHAAEEAVETMRQQEGEGS